jgi:hypothetical protein
VTYLSIVMSAEAPRYRFDGCPVRLRMSAERVPPVDGRTVRSGPGILSDSFITAGKPSPNPAAVDRTDVAYRIRP